MRIKSTLLFLLVLISLPCKKTGNDSDGYPLVAARIYLHFVDPGPVSTKCSYEYKTLEL